MSVKIGQPKAPSPTTVGGWNIVATADDFPPANGSGVRNLPSGSSWLITGAIDLGTTRLNCTGAVALAGASPETCTLTSDLGAGVPIVESDGTLTLRDVAFDLQGSSVGVKVDGSVTANAACDWVGVNFTGSTSARGVILDDVTNAIFMLCAWLGPDGILVETAIDTIAVTESLMSLGATGQKGLAFGTDAVVNRRIRFESSAIVVLSGATGFDVSATNAPSSESFILNRINFAGPGTYTNGLAVLDDNVRWSECRGITNSTRLGEMFFSGNSTTTTISSSDTYVKVAGTTTAGSINQRFDHTSGRLTYASALAESFRISIVATLTSGNNRVIGLRAYKNGVAVDARVSKSTTSGTGRSENIVYEAAVKLEQDDYIEVFVANTTATNNITVEDLSVTVSSLT